MIEEWREIAGFDGWYEVSNLGRVRSWKNNRWGRVKTPRTLKPFFIGQHEYLGIALVDEGGKHNHYIHQLVAEVFGHKRPAGFVCRHLDGDKYNNTPGNLQWGTARENSADTVAHGRSNRGARCPNSILTEGQVLEIFARANEPPASLAREFGVHRATIHNILDADTWSWLTGAA